MLTGHEYSSTSRNSPHSYHLSICLAEAIWGRYWLLDLARQGNLEIGGRKGTEKKKKPQLTNEGKAGFTNVSV